MVLVMLAVWLVLIVEQSQIVILPAVSLVFLLSAVWLVLILVEQSQIHTGTLIGLAKALVWVEVQVVVAQIKMPAMSNRIIGTTVITRLWITGISVPSGQ